jgi:uncharacterized UPF0160 family protein
VSKKLITHSEEFHTDDVFATALLLKLYPDAEVIRSRDEAVIESGDIVYDVGKVYDTSRGRYDHHQAQAGKRDDGIIYSSFGLLWKEYGVEYCEGDSEVAAVIDQKLAAPIDAIDNGQDLGNPSFNGVLPFTVDSIIDIYNPLIWLDESERYDDQFQKAVMFAQEVLDRLRKNSLDSLTSQRALLKAYAAADDKRIVVMDKPASTAGVLEHCPELLYLISQRADSSWGILAVSVRPHSFQTRRPFPEAWRSQPAAELQNITGVTDATFCHATGFYAVCLSKEGAIALAKASLEADG